MGILGEYIGAIHTFVPRRLYVFERERINSQYGPGEPLVNGKNMENAVMSAEYRR
jgi:hypothetical protein